MPDNLSPADRRKTMRAVKSRGTGLERQLFAMLAGMALRGWRKNVKSLPGKPDAVFPRERLAIFVDGCFWHGCPDCHRPLPDTNRDYWHRKIDRNLQRDRANTTALRDGGWHVIRIWEHQMANQAERANMRRQVQQSLAERGGG